MNNPQIMKLISNMLFNNYLGDIKDAKPYDVILCKQYAFSGAANPLATVKFVMIGDLAKWCSLKHSSCNN